MCKGHTKTVVVKDFAVRFALTVTCSSKNADELIAQNGELGLFSIFSKMLPQVATSNLYDVLSAP